jgi:hypothetical protein
MALQYPLLFPYGERGFQLGIKYNQINNCVSVNDTKRKNGTIHEFLSTLYIIDPINLTHTYVMDNYQNKL